MKINVLFLCLGNICRSPMAEAVFREYVKKAGLKDAIEVDSAGLGHWHIGKPPHEGTSRLLKKHHIPSENMRARQFADDDARRFDYIIAMDQKNMVELEQVEGPCIRKLLDFHPFLEGEDVPDPYLTGNFDEVYEMVQQSCASLLNWVRKRENI